MAIALTTEFKKVKETKMGSWGYGTLYLRTYAKFNANNEIVVEGRVYNNGTYCYSGNCYATVQGVNKKNNVRIDFTGKSEIVLGDVTVAGGTVTAVTTFRCYAFGLDVTFKAEESVTIPCDTAIGLDFDIGSATNITVTRYNSSYTRTVVASIGSFSHTILTKGTDTTIPVVFPENDLYEQIPNSNTGEITLTTTTYNGDAVVGTTTSKFKCRVVDSNPTIDSVEIKDANPSIAGTIIRYITKPTFTINATGKNYATIAKYSVTELNSEAITGTSKTLTSGNAVVNNSFTVTVTDSRGNTSTTTVTASNFVAYILPAISKVDATRTGENLDKLQVNIKGTWFNSKFISQANTMLLKYRYKAGTGEYSAYKTLSTASQEGTFDVAFELADTFDVNTVYTIEIAIDDYLRTGTNSAPVGKAKALIDHWEENGIDYYNINAEILQNGEALASKPPVGAVVITGTNTNPGATYGGTWTLIDKEFTPADIGDVMQMNSTNTTQSRAYGKRGGHTISFNANFVNKVAFNDTQRELGTLDLASMGVTRLSDAFRTLGFSDGGNAEIFLLLENTGVLSTVDVGGNITSVAKDNTFFWNITITWSDINQMLDSACNKFYWKRTA